MCFESNTLSHTLSLPFLVWHIRKREKQKNVKKKKRRAWSSIINETTSINMWLNHTCFKRESSKVLLWKSSRIYYPFNLRFRFIHEHTVVCDLLEKLAIVILRLVPQSTCFTRQKKKITENTYDRMNMNGFGCDDTNFIKNKVWKNKSSLNDFMINSHSNWQCTWQEPRKFIIFNIVITQRSVRSRPKFYCGPRFKRAYVMHTISIN